MRLSTVLLSLMLALPAPLWAVQPDEMLPDAAQEARAREISRNLRCPVCQGESIDDSNAAISRDLRLVVRERIVAGDSDAEVIDFVVARYGEFVLFNPKAQGANLILWLAGPGLLPAGGGIALAYVRRRAAVAAPAEAALTAEEEARLRDLLKE